MNNIQNYNSDVSAENGTKPIVGSSAVEVEAPYYDKHGREIKEFTVLKVFHFIGQRNKRHYMYKWVRLIEDRGKKYWYAQHLTDATAFFEKGSDKCLTGYALRAVANPERKLMDTEVVQQYD